jgi:hypothetical protein
MLRAVPTSWLRWDYTLCDGEAAITTLEIDVAWETGTFSLGPKRYQVFFARTRGGAFVLQSDDVILARAIQLYAVELSFRVEAEHKHYIFEVSSVLQRKCVLREGDQILGAVYPAHAFTWKAIIDLPPQMALPVRVFLTWLAIILLKRAAGDTTAS